MNLKGKELVAACAMLAEHMAGCTAALSTGENFNADYQSIMETMRRQRAAVRGNRPDTATFTGKDLRLFMIGAFRICMEHLEGQQ